MGDIRDHFNGQVREKTLQRDVLELVEGGLVKKDGDNRWTIYTFIGHLGQMSDMS